MFFKVFINVFEAQAKVYLIILLAAILVRTNVFSRQDVKGLTAIIVNLLLPCLISSNITETFEPERMTNWFILPLSAILLSAVGLGIAWIMFRRELPGKKNLLPVASMQNAGYLALPLGKMLFPEQFEIYALYIFLFILGLSPILWSVGKMLSTGNSPGNSKIPGFITPPFLANIVAILLVFLGWNRYLPVFVRETLNILGEATVPLANFVLGAIIGGIVLNRIPPLKDVLRVISVKFVLMPLIMLLVLTGIEFRTNHDLLTQVLMIQAASPPATAIMLQVNKYGGDEQSIGIMMFISLIVCLPAIPFWLALWNSIAGML